jgi:hypothetical protein
MLPRRPCRPVRRGERGGVTSSVAATDDALDEDLVRLPAGRCTGWYRGQNSTVCGLSLHRSRLRTFPGWSGRTCSRRRAGMADHVQAVCPALPGRAWRGGRQAARLDAREPAALAAAGLARGVQAQALAGVVQAGQHGRGDGHEQRGHAQVSSQPSSGSR